MKKKLGVKVLFLSAIVVFALNSIIAVMYGKVLNNTNIEQLAIGNMHALEIVLASIDKEKLKTVVEEQSMESEEYKEINQMLQRIRKEDNLTYLYIESYSADGEKCYYLIDALDPEDENFYALGEEDQINSYAKLSKGENLISDIIEVSDGEKKISFMTVELPIMDEDGTLIASIGTDICVDSVIGLIRKNILIMVAMLLAISVVELGLLYSGLSRLIVRPVKNLHEVVKATSNLDFSDAEEDLTRIKEDEIGEMQRLIHEMRNSLREEVTTMKEIGIQVAQASETLSETAEQSTHASSVIYEGVDHLTDGVEKQMSETEKSQEIFNMLSGHLDDVTAKLEKMDELTSGTKNMNMECSKSIDMLEETFKTNEEITNNVNSNMKVLMEQTKAIEQIVEVISNITKKTNLLSLNAAIEAARAGQAGKGFVVVAEEIKGLADNTQASAAEIKNIVENLIYDIQHMSSGVSKLVDSTNSLKEVSGSIGGVFEQTESRMFEMFELLEKANSEIQTIMVLKDSSADSIDCIKEEAEEYRQITGNMDQSVKEEMEIVKQMNEISCSLKEKSNELLVLTSEYKL